jgi:hypothetical protein
MINNGLISLMGKLVIKQKPFLKRESKLQMKSIGMTGFEPATLASQMQCATKLRYIPLFIPLL